MKRIFTTTLLIGLIGLLSVAAQVRIYAPQLSLPANEAVDQMPNVVLDWNGVTGGNTGIIHYQVQLDTDPSFGSPVEFETEFLTAIQTENLSFGETYFWRVRAIDGNDVSDWSETWSFRVILKVILSKPTDASNQSTEVTFQWEAITGILEYDLQVDTTYFWKGINSGVTSNLLANWVLDETHAWMAGAGGTILYFDGTTWTEQESSTNNDLYSISFVDEANGWAVGKGGVIIHYDGTQWAAQTSGTTNDLNGVHFLDATHGWAVGKTGIVLFYDGSSWSQQTTLAKDLNKVYAVDNSHVWTVGKGGFISFFDGSSWTDQTSGTTKDIFGLNFISPDYGWAVGKVGLLLNYNNGTWTIYNSSDLTTKDLNDIWVLDQSNAWAIGKTGTVLQFDGIEWFSQTAGTASNLNNIGFYGAAGFISGDGGTLVSYNDEAFSSPFAYTFAIPSEFNSTLIYHFPFGKQVYWRMRAKTSSNISGWSGARSFVVKPTVELDKPNTASTDQSLDVTLKWKKYGNLVTYDIQIDDDPLFGSPVFLSSTTISVQAEQLKFGTLYYWRVRAVNEMESSQWSEPWTFTTINTVTLKTPANNAMDVSLSPLLTWVPLTGITGYYVQLATSPDFSEILVESNVDPDQSQAATPMVLERSTTYFWRVMALNGLDETDWSETWAFTTVPPVGIDEPGLDSRLNIYPNPVKDNVFIQLTDKKGVEISVRITDLLGKTVLSKEFRLETVNAIEKIDVTALKDGIYMMRISDGENVYTRKILISR